jgi:hypothetical protein
MPCEAGKDCQFTDRAEEVGMEQKCISTKPGGRVTCDALAGHDGEHYGWSDGGNGPCYRWPNCALCGGSGQVVVDSIVDGRDVGPWFEACPCQQFIVPAPVQTDQGPIHPVEVAELARLAQANVDAARGGTAWLSVGDVDSEERAKWCAYCRHEEEGCEATRAFEWLTEQVYNGNGCITFCMTENGNIGLWLDYPEDENVKSIATGDEIVEVIIGAYRTSLTAAKGDR